MELAQSIDIAETAGTPETGMMILKNKQAINMVTYDGDINNITALVEKITGIGVETVVQVLNKNSTGINWRLSINGFINLLRPYSEELKLVNNCIEKVNEGLDKLKASNAAGHSKLGLAIMDLEEGLADLKETWLPRLQHAIAVRRRKNIVVLATYIIAASIAGELIGGVVNHFKG